MPYTDIGIINNGLGKYSSSRVNSITPPRSPLEVRCTEYPQWRESELAKRRWVFATDFELDLPQIDAFTDKKFAYRYLLPNNVLRPIRESGSEWRQSQRFIDSNVEDLTIPVTLNVPEANFDPLFVDVLACRVWIETVSLVTQTDNGREGAVAAYNEAVATAAKNNAFVIGPEDINDDDTAYDFLTGRW